MLLELLLTATLVTTPECPDPERPIHYMPYCLTPAEYQAIIEVPPMDPITPIPVTGVEQWRPLVEKYWPADLVNWAMKIMQCESGGDPNADNPYSTAAGLFQFIKSTWDKGPAPALGLPYYWTGAPFVPEWNIQAAAWLYEHWGGTSQWQCKASK